MSVFERVRSKISEVYESAGIEWVPLDPDPELIGRVESEAGEELPAELHDMFSAFGPWTTLVDFYRVTDPLNHEPASVGRLWTAKGLLLTRVDPVRSITVLDMDKTGMDYGWDDDGPVGLAYTDGALPAWTYEVAESLTALFETWERLIDLELLVPSRHGAPFGLFVPGSQETTPETSRSGFGVLWEMGEHEAALTVGMPIRGSDPEFPGDAAWVHEVFREQQIAQTRAAAVEAGLERVSNERQTARLIELDED